MIDPKQVVFFVPPGLQKFKLDLFERIARHIRQLGGKVVHHDYKQIEQCAADYVPIVGCSPPFQGAIRRWMAEERRWIYWDRGYLRRVFATWLPRGSDMGIPGGYYRWHVGRFQAGRVRDVPDDRWQFLKLNGSVREWNRKGDHIVVIDTLPDYWHLRGLPREWPWQMAEQLKRYTSRPIRVRDKESKVPLGEELKNAHALVTHGSIAAVEAVVMGCPVFVDKSSAAAVVGMTDFSLIETPLYPERMAWLHSLAYDQFNERELCDGTLWKLME